MEIILTYAAMWAPSIVALLGIIVTVIKAIGSTKAAILEFKNNTDVADLRSEVKKVALENEELVRCNKLLLEQITHIKNYADEVKKK